MEDRAANLTSLKEAQEQASEYEKRVWEQRKTILVFKAQKDSLW